MKLQRVLQKLIATLLLTIIVMNNLEGLKTVAKAVTIKSPSEGNLYLGLSAVGDNIGYAIDMTSNGTEGKNIWNIKSYQTASQNSASVTASNLYCIKAGYGYTWENLKQPNTVLTYSQSPFSASAVDGYYNEILWIIDHMYILGEDNKEEFLKSIGIESYEDSGYKLYYYSPIPGYDYSSLSSANEFIYTLTDDDIVAVQQAAIWYYTNYKINPTLNGVYNKLGSNSSWLKYTKNGTNYEEVSAINRATGEGPARNEFANILYNYLIEAAEKEVAKLGGTYKLKNKTVKLWTATTLGNSEQPIIEIHKKQKEGKYDLTLIKEDENGEQLNSTATFIVDGVEKTVTGRLTIASNVQITKDNLKRTDTYTIKEKTPPDEYCEFNGIITVSVTKKETDDGYEVANVTYVVKDEVGNDITSSTGDTVNVYLKDGNIYVEVKNYPEEKAFDLALRKVITQVRDRKGNIKGITDANGNNATRNVTVDRSTLNNEDDNRNTDTATYRHRKDPVLVEKGDIVKYTVTIYNEGEQSGYATKIVDQLPGLPTNGLRLLSTADVVSTTGNVYGVEYSTTTNTVTFTLKSTPKVLPAYNGTTLAQETIELECEVTANINSKQTTILTNIAYIAEEYNSETKEVITTVGDRDSQPAVHPTYKGENDTKQDGITYGGDVGYKGHTSNPSNLSQNNTYYKGEQDDDDFEKLVVLPKSFDLKLVKYIDEINGKSAGNRILNVDTSKLNTTDRNGNLITTAEYEMEKNPITVKATDFIKYTFRIYNEGEFDGYATEISEDIPQGLEALLIDKDASGNIVIYSWDGKDIRDVTSQIKDTDMYEQVVKTNSVWKHKVSTSVITTNALKDEKIKAFGIKDYKNYADQKNKIDYKEVSVIFRVKADVVSTKKTIRNEAAITEDKAVDENNNEILDSIGNPIEDRDSDPKKWNKEDSGKDYNKDGWEIYKEDDEDYDNVIVKEFDLALRKFITQIEETGVDENKIQNGEITTTEVTSRIPEISYDKTTNKITYTHTKDPLIVHVADTVIYTIRVYNEGDIDGYAQEVTDDIPEYLEFLPGHNTNKYFEWKMYDKDGNETKDVTKAVKIKTTHLAKGEGEEKGAMLGSSKYTANLIKAFNPEVGISSTNPDYRDLKVAFKVKDPNSSEQIIKNFAEISEDSDEYGDPIDDIDSVPDNGTGDPIEDDEDIENIRVEYFDLALLKYVTKAIVTEDGNTKVIETGNIGDENDIVPKVEINRKKINKTVVKFAYTIKITNEGNIAGCATEITDYIPEGLAFKAEDNPNWVDEGNGVISTRALENILLEPGESAEVEVILTWINGENNLGAKINVAEISEDYNDKGIPDRDSTPDNQKDGEDDIDDAEVILSIKTGGGLEEIYVNIALIPFVILLIGIVLIKRYVI
ncbi:MAG: Cys-Gln thioester bond-forming surface protein [Clostridia bacterium]|nr:Cys-Gln thioester bond-forming surface protein [Clostridia bacterium]